MSNTIENLRSVASKCNFKIKNLRQNKSPCNSRNDILEETLVENLRTFEGFPKQTDDCWTYEGRCCYIHTIPGQNCFIHQEIPYQYICIAVLRNRKLPVKSKRVHSIILVWTMLVIFVVICEPSVILRLALSVKIC